MEPRCLAPVVWVVGTARAARARGWLAALACVVSVSCGGADSSVESSALPDIPPTDEPASARHRPLPLGTTDAGQGYWEYLPPGYGDDQRYPLLVFLHGVGANGNGDSDLADVLRNGPPELIDADAWPSDRPFVLLSPQHRGEGCPPASEVSAFLDFAIDAYDINPRRVYLTGLSCGGVAAWNYLAEFVDERIAATVPIAGNGKRAWDEAGCDLGRAPIWAFHGQLDEIEPVLGTTEPVANLQDCDPRPDVEMVIYPDAEHDSWSRTYDTSAGHEIYDWMLERVR